MLMIVLSQRDRWYLAKDAREAAETVSVKTASCSTNP